MNEVDIVKDCLIDSPLVIKEMDNEYLLQIIDNIIPYSIGFEVECDRGDNFKNVSFSSIPNIMEVNIDSNEQRFRIPSGRRGAVCLKDICDQLVVNSKINMGSGIHYHVDMTETFEFLNDENIQENHEWILKELDSWGYTGTYNPRSCGKNSSNWVNFQRQFKTAEFRIGEMTFDYSLMMKRIIHVSEIVKKLNSKILKIYTKVRPKKEDIVKELTEEEIMYLVRSRTIKCY